MFFPNKIRLRYFLTFALDGICIPFLTSIFYWMRHKVMITLFIVLAFLFFKDPIKKQQILGIIVTLFGIVLLSLFSS